MNKDRELQKLRAEINNLHETKQTKMSATTIAIVIILFIGLAASAVSILTTTYSSNTGDRYRAAQAKADFTLRDYQIQTLTERVRTLEHKVEQLQSIIDKHVNQ